ncbi:MAG TPA: ATP synthase F1 subunit delta [Thermodesulfobacteriota bacterium]|nr:ATP synthase F1 subunit delta [Thermodesulfobacteriota bacterium]
MKKTIVARRFAKALIDVGVEENSAEMFGRDLRTLFGIFEANPELYKVLLNPMYRLEERRALMEKVSGAVGAAPGVTKFMNILVNTRNIRLLEDVVASYQRFEDEIIGRLRATVESPQELSEGIIAGIKEKLKALTGKEVIINRRLNKALLGGVVIRMNNTVVDGSLRTQLEAMKEKILEGVA